MNTRIKRLIQNRFEFAPHNAYLIVGSNQIPRLSQGVEIELDRYLNKNPNTRLVVVDPFTFIETPPKRKQPMRSYQEDYEAIVRLTNLTREKYPHVAILLVYHMRKEGSGNWLDTVMGTTGLAGAVDNLLFIRRENAKSDAVLYLTGKDIEKEAEYAMRFDKETANWELLGDAQEFTLAENRQEIVDCIKDGIIHYAQIAKAIGKNPSTVRSTLSRMKSDGKIISLGKGCYDLVSDFTPQLTATSATSATNATGATGATNQDVAVSRKYCNNDATNIFNEKQEDSSSCGNVAVVAVNYEVNNLPHNSDKHPAIENVANWFTSSNAGYATRAQLKKAVGLGDEDIEVLIAQGIIKAWENPDYLSLVTVR